VIAAAAALSLSACGGAHRAPTASRPAPPVASPTYAPSTPVAQPDPNVYPASVRQRFERACEHGGTPRAICTCTFARLRERYTARRFVDLFRASRGREPPVVQRAAQDCERS